ncbi:radical SAM protein [Marinilabilia rubra]|uniref:Radical SAM protein n=1 Tax=Marinilabilia rubra TaxID=2162893 RepID=A0A2U2B4E4_9BACT|nr:radical SAM protein [Marinilabilia rubra]PWD97904.1 radical SAM protein [Marinilabilia rubra]
MEGLLRYRNRMVERNRLEYGVYYDDINWINYGQALQLEQERDELLTGLKDMVQWGFKGTKTDVSGLSPGCRLCAEGQWSCLFINGKCNCNCFYCPAPQSEIGSPVTQTLSFEDPLEYVDYIRKFGFKGISFSGGEPFVTFDKMLKFLKVFRRELADDLYIWAYTNGTLVREDKLKALADAGINELRFDIGATNYDLRFAKKALPIIPKVTVEIPAIPDEKNQIVSSVKELWEEGLSYLNLHQLRLTPYNRQKLSQRGYMVAHGARATLPESEVAALGILHHFRKNGIEVPVNYCSYAYKNRFQKSGLRHKLAPRTVNEWEDITENGYIRNLSVDLNKFPGASEVLMSLFKGNHSGIKWDSESNRFFFKLEYLKTVPAELTVELGYRDVRISDKLGEIPDFEKVKIGNNREIYVETAFVVNDLEIHPTMREMLLRIATGVASPEEWQATESLHWIAHFEIIEEGLSVYY